MHQLLLRLRKRLLENTISPRDFKFKFPEGNLIPMKMGLVTPDMEADNLINACLNSTRDIIKQHDLNNFFSRYSSFVKFFYPLYFSSKGEYRQIVKRIIDELEDNFSLIYTNLMRCFEITNFEDKCFTMIFYFKYQVIRPQNTRYRIDQVVMKDSVKKYFLPVTFDQQLTSENLLSVIDLFFPECSNKYYLDKKRLEEIEQENQTEDINLQKIKRDINILTSEINSVKEENDKIRLENQQLKDYIRERLILLDQIIDKLK